jgi:predicted phosphodiesterase
MKTLVVSDIHGMYKELMSTSYSDSDRLIYLGDYIDRGGQSKEVMDFQDGQPWIPTGNAKAM